MKKLAAVIVIIFIGIVTAFAQKGLVFGSDTFKVDILKKKHMVAVPKKDLPSGLKIDQAFTNDKKSYQLRYSFFKQVEKNVDDDTLLSHFATMAYTYLMNSSEQEINLDEIKYYEEAILKSEYNADFGMMAFIEYPKPEVSKGYNGILISFFLKKNHGMVVQELLLKDSTLFEDPILMEIMRSFKFKK